VDVKFHCPTCLTKLKVDARFGGQTVPCPKCAVTLPVPQWYGTAGEIVGEVEAAPNPVRVAVGLPAIVLSAEELAFLGANQEVG
jgi:hypothetical protein